MTDKMNAPAKSKTSKSETPIELLKQDHATVQSLFKKFAKVKDAKRKEKIVRTAIEELKIHMAVEEELFYPAVREEFSEDEMEELMDEAMEEHHVVKLLIQELDEMGPEDERFNAKFTVLAENIQHHIQEEESEIFPKVKRSDANSEEIGARMAEFKQDNEKMFRKAA